MRDTGLFDINGEGILEGHILEYEGVYYLVMFENDIWVATGIDNKMGYRLNYIAEVSKIVDHALSKPKMFVSYTCEDDYFFTNHWVDAWNALAKAHNKKLKEYEETCKVIEDSFPDQLVNSLFYDVWICDFDCGC